MNCGTPFQHSHSQHPEISVKLSVALTHLHVLVQNVCSGKHGEEMCIFHIYLLLLLFRVASFLRAGFQRDKKTLLSRNLCFMSGLELLRLHAFSTGTSHTLLLLQ